MRPALAAKRRSTTARKKRSTKAGRGKVVKRASKTSDKRKPAKTPAKRKLPAKPAKRSPAKPAKRRAVYDEDQEDRRRSKEGKARKSARQSLIEAMKAGGKARSDAAKKGWSKRRARTALIEAMQARGWEVDIPTTPELYDLLSDIGEQMGYSIGNMYRMYKGYDPI